MSREIKFRGKRIGNGEWVEGDLTRYSKYMSYITVDLVEGEVYEVLTPTVGQYTGLHDKNGTEIYEGDIIRTRETDADDWEIYLVKYFGEQDYPAFDTEPHIDCDSNGLSHAMACCEVEIIGNIHDNPELIGGDAP